MYFSPRFTNWSVIRVRWSKNILNAWYFYDVCTARYAKFENLNIYQTLVIHATFLLLSKYLLSTNNHSLNSHRESIMTNCKNSRVYSIRRLFGQQFYMWLTRDLDVRPTILMNHAGASHDNYSVAVNQTPTTCLMAHTLWWQTALEPFDLLSLSSNWDKYGWDKYGTIVLRGAYSL